MNITMTWGDMAAALALGIFGSLVASYCWSILPRIRERLVIAWSHRSQKAATKRAATIEKHLKQIERFKIDSPHYITTSLGQLGKVVRSFALALASLIGLTLAVTIPRQQDFLKIAVAAFISAFAIFWFRYLFQGMRDLATLWKFSDLDQHEKTLNKQLDELRIIINPPS